MAIEYPPNPTQFVDVAGRHHWDNLTEDEKHFAHYKAMLGELKELKRNIVNRTRVVEEWAGSQSGDDITVPTGSIGRLVVRPAFHADAVITSVVATFPTASTSVSLQLGDRIFPIAPAAGYINWTALRIQLDYNDDRVLNINPAGACMLSLYGYCDFAASGMRGTQRG